MYILVQLIIQQDGCSAKNERCLRKGELKSLTKFKFFNDRPSYLDSFGDVLGMPNRRKSNSAFRNNKAVFVTRRSLSPRGVGL